MDTQHCKKLYLIILEKIFEEGKPPVFPLFCVGGLKFSEKGSGLGMGGSKEKKNPGVASRLGKGRSKLRKKPGDMSWLGKGRSK